MSGSFSATTCCCRDLNEIMSVLKCCCLLAGLLLAVDAVVIDLNEDNFDQVRILSCVCGFMLSNRL